MTIDLWAGEWYIIIIKNKRTGQRPERKKIMLAPYIIITRNENGEEREYTTLFLTSISREEKIELAKKMYEVDGFKIVNHSF